MCWPGKRKIRVLVWCTLLLLALVIFGYWLNPNRHLEFIAEQASAALGGEVSASAIDWGFDQGFWLQLKQLSIRDATLIPADISASRIYARAALKPLIDGKLVIKQLTIEDPKVSYRLQEAAATETDTAAETTATSTGFPLRISMVELLLSNGQLTIEDSLTVTGRTLVQQFEAVDIELRELATGPALHLSLAAKTVATPSLPSGTLHLKGSLQGLTEQFDLQSPWLDAELSIDTLPLQKLKGYLNNPDLEQRLGGLISGQLNYTGDIQQQGEVQAKLDLGSLQYHDIDLWPQPLPGSALDLRAHISQDGDDLRLEQLHIDADELTISAVATLEKWRQQPLLSDGHIVANLPLAELSPLVPWPLLGDAAPLLRSILDGGGVVELTRLELPAIDIHKTIDTASLLAAIGAEATLANIAVPAGPRRPPVNDLHGELQLVNGELTGTRIGAIVGALRLPDATFNARNLLNMPIVDATVLGDVNLANMPARHKRKLLAQVGLRQLDMHANIALQAHYEHASPQDWQAHAQLTIDDLDLTTLSPETSLSARGHVKLRRQQLLDVFIPELAGRINGTPFTLSGQLFAIGHPDFLADLQVMVKNLKLEALTPWADALQPYRLAGRLSTDLDLYYLQSDPGKTRARGPLMLRNAQVYLPDNDILIDRASAKLTLAANRYHLEEMSLRANEQTINLSGKLQNPSQPKLSLKLHSPNLDLDRLIPAPAPAATPTPTEDTPPSKPFNAAAAPSAAKLPELAMQTKLALDIDIDKGSYRSERFKHLALDVNYRQGTLQRADLTVNVAGGKLKADTTAILLDLKAIPFTLDYQLKQIDLGTLTRLVTSDGQQLSSGRMNSKGQLRANTQDLMQSLRGALSLRAGPGKITNDSPAANTLFNILSLLNLQSIISGDIGSGMAVDGMHYDQLALDARFLASGIKLEHLELDTPAFTSRAVGDVNLARKDMDIDAVITVFATLDTVLGLVPLLGRAAAELTKVYLKISGSLDQPKVRVQPVEGLSSGIDSALELPLGILEFKDP
jgi:hypothetical protein